MNKIDIDFFKKAGITAKDCVPLIKMVIESEYAGIKEGVSRYAHWKDGVEYVGNMGTPLKEALAKVESEKHEALSKALERLMNIL